MRIIQSMGHVVGGTLLVAGTTIGVGMLALPVATGPGGFIPAAIIYGICWIFMLATGFALVEVCLSMPKDTSFISMADKILGPAGKALFWIVYLFLFGTVMIAHSVGGGQVLTDIVGWNVPSWFSTALYTIVCAPVVYLGARSVDRLNMVLISGVAVCYLGFVFVAAGSVDPKLLSYANWGKAWYGLPILFTAFTYQVIVPTLVTYMERNVKKIRLAILFGSLLPLLIYLVWELLILGIVPVEGTHGLIEAQRLGQNAIGPLREYLARPIIFQIGKYFAFFALTTSYIPLALSFFDFLADGLKWKKKGKRRFLLCCLSFGVPLWIAILYPHIFLVALGYAGGISCALLFGFMPPLMVWVGRYIQKTKVHPMLPGGKPLLGTLMLFASLILVGEILLQVT